MKFIQSETLENYRWLVHYSGYSVWFSVMTNIGVFVQIRLCSVLVRHRF